MGLFLDVVIDVVFGPPPALPVKVRITYAMMSHHSTQRNLIHETFT